MTRSTPRRSLAVLCCLVAVALCRVAADSGPAFWTIATSADFLKGTSEGVYVTSTGVLTSGPQLTSRLTTTPAQIWGLAQGPDGSFWAGTGGDGRVIHLQVNGTEQTAFDSEETNVFAVATSGGRVFAATGPDGKVYVIDAGGAARPFFDPEEKYIWALAVDGEGRLWVGAGNPAVIYRVDANGAGQAIYKPPAAHVVSLFLDANGRMFAGTESPGRLYRFDAADKPFVVLETGLTELRAIAADATGRLFAAGVSKGDESSSGGETTSVAVTLASAAPPPASGSGSSTSSSASSSSTRRSALFQIDPTGSWEELWSTGDLIYDIAAQSDGVLVATGPEGRLYRVDRERNVYLLTGVDAKQITRFAAAPRTGALTAFATANPGRVVAVGAGQQSPATYTSSVRDTKSVASWGTIRWESTGSVVLSTRSGNTDKPDDSWSAWSAAYTRPEGATVTSPSARYLQWRAVLTQATNSPVPQLTSVTVAYLARNTRPVVSSITAYPPGVVFKRPYANDDTAIAGLDDAIAEARRPPGDTGPTPPTPTQRLFQRGLQTITWKGDDDDDDRLTYNLEYRREGETAWRELRTGLPDDIFVWDTSTVADGRYVLRVRASDTLSNAGDRALTGDRESDPIVVDNTPPAITAQVTRQGNMSRLFVHVVDARSPIQKVEYSLGAGPWQLVYPVDGLADSPDERYEIPLASEGDAARIVIRATDLLQNVMSQPASP